ncbi:MAG: peptidase, partial [Nitrosopumilus sp.]|nr:peptidase [Nitrosopumilus sp.]
MKIIITAIAAILLLASTASVYAEVPAWVKTNAGWWADGTISESEFLSGIEFLITNDIIVVPSTA